MSQQEYEDITREVETLLRNEMDRSKKRRFHKLQEKLKRIAADKYNHKLLKAGINSAVLGSEGSAYLLRSKILCRKRRNITSLKIEGETEEEPEKIVEG